MVFDLDEPRTVRSAAGMPPPSAATRSCDARQPTAASPAETEGQLKRQTERRACGAQMREATTSLRPSPLDLHWHYVVKGWWLRREVSVVYGPSNVGKTTFVIDVVRAVATGAQWHGRRTRGGAVLYVAAESGISVVERAHGLLGDDGRKVFLLEERPSLLSDIDVDAIIDLANHCAGECGEPVAMIVFDTLTLCMGAGDENSNADAVRVAAATQRIARETGAHVMLVHHSGKDRSAGPRGASGLVGNADTVVELVAVNAESDNYVLAHAVKQRRMSRLRPFAFRLRAVVLGEDEDGEDRTTSRLDAHEDQAAAAPRPGSKSAGDASAREAAVIEALRVLAAEGNSAEGFARAAIADACSEMPAFRGLNRESLLKAVGRALDGTSSRPQATIEAVGADRHRPKRR